MQTRPAKERHLLVTMTNEPFQPVRLYYAVPDRSLVIRKLTALHCMVEVPSERCWHWLFPEEETPDFNHLATALQFRFVRAFEHWRGNTHLTLTAIIVRTVEQGMRDRGGHQGP